MAVQARHYYSHDLAPAAGGSLLFLDEYAGCVPAPARIGDTKTVQVVWWRRGVRAAAPVPAPVPVPRLRGRRGRVPRLRRCQERVAPCPGLLNPTSG